MIRTERLTLIPLTRQQLETGLVSARDLAAQINYPIVADLMQGQAEVAIRKKLEIMRDVDPAQHNWITYWLIVINSENIAAGLLGFKGLPSADGSVEIGYGINSIYQSLGYMTEAVKALVVWAFSHPECRRITANTLPDNIRSRRVLLKNCFNETGSEGDEILYELKKAGFPAI